MLALFRFFLAFFLGVDASDAVRLTEPAAWGNPIAQVQALVGPCRGLRTAGAGPSWKGEANHAHGQPAHGGPHVPRADRHPRPGTP